DNYRGRQGWRFDRASDVPDGRPRSLITSTGNGMSREAAAGNPGVSQSSARGFAAHSISALRCRLGQFQILLPPVRAGDIWADLDSNQRYHSRLFRQIASALRSTIVAPVITGLTSDIQHLPLWVNFTDVGTQDAHTCTIAWGDGQTTSFPASEGG